MSVLCSSISHDPPSVQPWGHESVDCGALLALVVDLCMILMSSLSFSSSFSSSLSRGYRQPGIGHAGSNRIDCHAVQIAYHKSWEYISMHRIVIMKFYRCRLVLKPVQSNPPSFLERRELHVANWRDDLHSLYLEEKRVLHHVVCWDRNCYTLLSWV